ncbi:MAG: O-antigen ligase family protein, partial [Abditibacteriales bacterium]|nr:O-antigen ligase family protein [Abditibacteriales bacterium]
LDLSLFSSLLMITSALLVLYGARFLLDPQLRWQRSALFLPLLLLLAACAFSLLDTVFWRASLHEFLRLLTVASLFFLTVQLCSNVHRIVTLMGAIVVGGTWAAVVGIYQQKASPDLAWRPFSFFVSQNLFAGYLMLALPLTVGIVVYLRSGLRRALRDSPRLPVVLAVGEAFPVMAALLMLYALGLSGSRGGWLAFFAAVIVGFVGLLRSMPHLPLRLRRALPIGVVVVLIAIAVLSVPLRVRLVGLTQGEQLNSIMFRWFTWKGTAKMAAAYPFNGTGIGTFEYICPQFTETGFTRAAHQTYLQFAAETGVVGGAAFLWLMVSVTVLTWKGLRGATAESRPLLLALLVAIVGFALHNLVDYSWNVTPITLTFLACAAIANVQCPMTGVRWELGNWGIGKLGNWSLVAGRWSLSVRRRVGFGVLVAVCLLLNATMQRQVAAERARVESEVRLSARNLRAAVEEARQAVSLDPSAVENHLQLAYCYAAAYLATRDAAVRRKAVAAFERAIALAPTDVRPYKRLADFWRQVHEPERERTVLTRALRRHPRDVGVLVRRGKIELDFKNRTAALVDFLKVAHLANAPYGKYSALSDLVDINYARAYLYLSQIDTEMTRYDDALRWIEQGLDLTQRALDKERQFWSKLRAAGVPVQAPPPSDIRQLRGELWEQKAKVYAQRGEKEQAAEATKQAQQERAEEDA